MNFIVTHRNKAVSIVSIVLFVLIWHYSLANNWVLPSAAASPYDVVLIVLSDWREIFSNLSISLMRLGFGVLFGVGLGMISGVVIARQWALNASWGLFLRFISPIPVVIWIPFVIGAIDSEEFQKIFLVFIPSFLITSAIVYQHVREAGKDFIELAQMYEKKLFARMAEIYFPISLSATLTSLRLTLYLSWIVLFLVEYGQSSATAGLGYYISDNLALGKIEHYFSGVCVLAASAFILDALLSRIKGTSAQEFGN